MIRRPLGMLAMCGAAAACGGSGSPTVDVLAASSYTDVADQLEQLIEAEFDVDLRFSFGSSGSFYEQLNQGAPASVVITANALTMERIEDAGLVEPSRAITTNEMVILTADTDSGRAIVDLADLGSAGAVVVLCASSAPCGGAADAVLQRAGVDVSVASREPNVRATLTKVLLGEADAAIVYRTDAIAHPEVRSVEIRSDLNVAVTGRAAGSAGDDVAADIVEFLGGAAAGNVFRSAGFESP